MATPSLQSLQKALEQSGLPFGDVKAMRDAKPLAKYTIAASQQAADTVTPQLMNERAQKIQRLADMDKRLNALYSDPGSKFASDNPFLKEGALNSMYGVEAANVGSTDQAIVQRQKEIDDTVSELVNLYSDITTDTAKKQVSTSSEIDFDAALDEALGVSSPDLSDDEVNAILEDIGLQ